MDVAAADADVGVGMVEDPTERRGVEDRAALRVGAAVAAADVETQPFGATVSPCDSPLVARPVLSAPAETIFVPS